MRFNGEIGLGSVINLIVMVAGGVFFLLTNEHRMTAMEAYPALQAIRDAAQDQAIAAAVTGIKQEISGLRDEIRGGRILPIGPQATRPANEFSQTPPVQ